MCRRWNCLQETRAQERREWWKITMPPVTMPHRPACPCLPSKRECNNQPAARPHTYHHLTSNQYQQHKYTRHTHTTHAYNQTSHQTHVQKKAQKCMCMVEGKGKGGKGEKWGKGGGGGVWEGVSMCGGGGMCVVKGRVKYTKARVACEMCVCEKER